MGTLWDMNFPKSHAVATSVQYAGTATDLADSTQGWITPGNATGDTTATSANMDIADRNVNTNTLALTNFNFSGLSIPTGATIDGIRVDVEWEVENTRVQDSRVQLTKNGTVGVGSDYANNAAGPTTKTITNYGGTTDLWGTTWTLAEINSANFGVLLQYVNTRNRDRTVDVYRVSITIDYSTPNNAPTDITLTGNTVTEGFPIGTNIGGLLTTDPDTGDTHTYSLGCTIAGADDANFAIAGSNLNSAIIFNYSIQSTHNLCIRTDDGNGGTFDKNFVISILPTPSPGGVSTNLELWLKADAGTSTTTDGTPITTWDDQSGNNLDATSVTTPDYRNNNTDSINFNPVIDFNGTNDYMQNLANGVYSNSYFLVIKPDTDIEGTASQGVPFGFNCNSGVLSSGACGLDFGGVALGAFTAAFPDEVITHALGSSANWRSTQSAIAIYPQSFPLIIEVNENIGGNGTDIYTSGNQVNNASANIYQTLSTADYSLGRSPDDTYPFPFDGKIAEVINYSGHVDDTSRQKIESYLAMKYGITLKDGAQNYIASDGATVWGSASAGVFTKNIFGIGRDDVQQLGQVKSKSVNEGAIITLEAEGEGTNISNTFVDIADKEFLMISHNDGGNTWSASGAPSGFNILERKWRTQEIGDTGNISLEFDVDEANFNVPALNAGTNYYIIYDSDGDDNLDDETPTALTNTSGSLWGVSGINPNTNRIFTIATEAGSNNIPTNISLSGTSINENVAAGTQVGAFSTTDADSGDSHIYSFVSGTGDDDNASFTIVGNFLNISVSPDYEIKNSYTIRVQTNDGNGGTYQKIFAISINNLSETISTIIDFETPGKYTVTSGQWNRTTTNPYEGIYSLESDNLGLANTQSCFEVTHTNAGTGTIDFFYNVSSEANDFLRFFVDDVEQQAWSGVVPWTQYSLPNISAGTHDYKWCYIKDAATDGGTDNAFIDYITFPSGVTDVTPPNITSSNFASGALLPGGNHSIIINYNDADSGIDTSTADLQLQKWDGISAYGPDISGSSIGTGTVGTGSANYPTLNLEFGKYRYTFSINDNEGNTATVERDFYIDIPEFIIGTGSVDMGVLNNSGISFSDSIDITVRTVGVAFDVIFTSTTNPTYSVENIPNWDGTNGYGFQQSPFSGTLSVINTNQNIASESELINTNGNKNTYTYSIQVGALIEQLQAGGDYVGDLKFDINLQY